MIRFPAEWEPQSAVVIAWPHKSGDFVDLAAVEHSYQHMAAAIARFQLLVIVCKDDAHETHIRAQLNNLTNIRFVHAPYNDIWLRDTVFLTVEWQHEKAKVQLLNFRFNGWGNKYAHDDDNRLNLALFAHPIFKGHPTATLDLVLEGGSVESDGAGTLMTTKNCLLNPNRNPHLDQAALSSQLAHYLGAKRILWVEQPNLAGDDTDAHIDTLARFCDSHTIAYTSCNDEQDPHYASLKSMEAQLKGFKTLDGADYELIDLPLPKPIFDSEGRQLPANYANFLLVNGAVLVPAYDDANDQIVVQRLAECFPGREVVAIPCKGLVQQYGSLHCATMQVPACVNLHA